MIRDKLKDLAYFERFIEKKERFIMEDIHYIKENDLNKDEIKSTQYSIFDYSVETLIAMYSEGRNLDDIKSYYSSNVLDYCKNGWFENSGGGYTSMLWMLSIGIMLEINQPEFRILTNLVKENNLNDYLLNLLISYRIPNWDMNTEKFVFYRPYNIFSEIITLSKEQAVKRLEKYLNKEWYQGNKDIYWYELHKNEFDLYFGYWSFESGAIAKMMGLEDAALKDHPYYPYDLVHYKK